MEHSAVVWDLFDKASPYVGDRENFLAIRALHAHPFHRAFVIVTAAADAAIRATRFRISTTLRVVSECHPAVADVESALLLQEAELLSTSNSVKELLAALHEGQEQLERRRDGWWGAQLAAPAGKGEETNAVAKPSLQLLRHLEAGLGTLEANVGRWRLQLALCKEELALYKREMFLFARANVIAGVDPLHPHGEEDAATKRSPALNTAHLRGSGERDTTGNDTKFSAGNDHRVPTTPTKAFSASTTPNAREEKPRFAIMAVSRHTRHVMDRVFQEAARTVRATPLQGSSRVWSIMSGRDAANLSGSNALVAGGTAGVDASKMVVPHFVYSPDEERRLEEAHVVLLERQREASAEDAKAVETSVRELSQLTSLMSERVVQQNEQFSILLKNTGEAQNNMSKAVGEVNKTLSSFWNSTRQLILWLWINICVLLIANWIIR